MLHFTDLFLVGSNIRARLLHCEGANEKGCASIFFCLQSREIGL